MPATREWVASAAEDQAVARLAAADGRWNAACFHAQQASEKLLKGIRESRNQPVPRTHDLERLCEILQGEGVSAEPISVAAESLAADGVHVADADEARQALSLKDQVAAWASEHLAGHR